MKKQYFITITVLFLSSFPCSAAINISAETGQVFNGYNDVRIPNDDGTRFSLTNDLSEEPSFFFRGRISYIFHSRHILSVLAAPLRSRSKGTLDKDVNFDGKLFPEGTKVTARYRFDSYRLSYIYKFVNEKNFSLGIGLTAKIRHASISLESNDQKAEYSNLGFVPLFHFQALWYFYSNWGFLFDCDALTAPQGRAEDFILALLYSFNDHLSVYTGYRMLEGGADNDKVYTFAMFHYATVGISYNF